MASEIVNLHYTFANETFEKPLDMPKEVINVNRSDLMENGKLSDYVQISNANSQFQIAFVHKGTTVWKIDDILLLPHVNNIQSTAYTQNVQGGNTNRMMGLWDRNFKDLYLDSGVYSLWSYGVGKPDQNKTLPASNTYSAHPVLFARAP